MAPMHENLQQAFVSCLADSECAIVDAALSDLRIMNNSELWWSIAKNISARLHYL